MRDYAFERDCERNAAIGEMLAQDRRAIQRRLAVCHHNRFNVIRGQRVCRDCGQVFTRITSHGGLLCHV